MIYQLVAPKKMLKNIRLDGNRGIVHIKEIRKWLEEKEKEVEQRLKKKGLERCSVNCFIEKDGEDEKPRLRVIISFSLFEIYKDFRDILMEEKDCLGRIVDIINKTETNGESYKEVAIVKGGKITIIH